MYLDIDIDIQLVLHIHTHIDIHVYISIFQSVFSLSDPSAYIAWKLATSSSIRPIGYICI